MKAAPGVTDIKNYLQIRDLTAKNVFMDGATESSSLNMRSGPGTEYDIVRKAAHESKVQLIKKMFNGWYFIKSEEGPEGFSNTDHLKDIPSK